MKKDNKDSDLIDYDKPIQWIPSIVDRDMIQAQYERAVRELFSGKHDGLTVKEFREKLDLSKIE